MNGFAYNQSVKLSATDQSVYQQDVVIHRTTGVPYEELVGGLYILHFYVGDKCKADYGDVRFTDAIGNVLAYYLWPDYDNSSARFAVRLDGATSAGQMQVWYGNPAASTTSDPDATYILHDHFDGSTLDTTKWGELSPYTSGTLSVSGSQVHISSTPAHGVWQNLISKSSFGPGVTAEFYGSATVDGNHIQIGFGDNLPATTDNFAILFSSGERHYYTKISGDASSTSTARSDLLSAPARWGITLTGTSVIYERNGVVKATHTRPLQTFPFGFATSGQSLHIDWVTIRTYSANPPSATAFSGEQDVGGSKASAGVTLGSANMMVI